MLYLGGLILAGSVCCVPISGSGDSGSPCYRTAPQYALLFCFIIIIIISHKKSCGKMILKGIKQSFLSPILSLVACSQFRIVFLLLLNLIAML